MISGKKQYCSGYSSCKGHTDTDVDPISSGFHNLLIKPANRAACYGADACAKATVEAGLSTLCMGAASCCRTDITTSQATVCAGYRSCQQSEINTDGGRVDSYGYQSAAESTIKGAAFVRADAYQTLLNAVIDSNGAGGGTYLFREYEAGKGATVICRNGDTCRVRCDGKGCKGLTYQCEPGATCTLSPNGCTGKSGKKYKNTACPTLTQGTAAAGIRAKHTLPGPLYEANIDHRDEIDTDRAKVPKMAPSCTQYRSWNSRSVPSSCTACQKKASCKGDRIREDGITTCSGDRSCVKATIVQKFTGALNYLRCGGDQACVNADITTKTRAYCTGQESCQDAEIVAQEYIGCEGESSCQESKLTVQHGRTATDPSLVGLRCNGKDSCFKAEIFTSGNGPLKCAGVNSCVSASITYPADVSCSGYNSCRSSTMNNQGGGNVDCLGEFSCLGAKIFAKSFKPNKEATVSIYGRMAGYTAEISADVVKAYANHALYGATVDSSDKSLVVEAYSPSAAAYAKIICRAGNKCMLKCKGSACGFSTQYICLPGAKCQVRPKKCKKRSGGSYKGTGCPTFETSITEETLEAHLNKLNKEILNDEEYKKLQVISDDLDHEYIDNEMFDDDDELDLDEGIF
eukprot:CAMPEP_0201575820 /NCGR_PEP_ID=MMETSP0190_2-20130828/21232_1 /ASSEMBLY_ACC=CAM_ASM_000263 /TAXON_ID=37353 /ORGANISM="Rosalina sp." /LENGTH=630 /DNA_ID=CAMNT_0048005909 /DNA_START=441 /DNA_END=2333 /DNA_ORIENTATION=+